MGEFSIFKYTRDVESVAVTLNQQQRSWERRLYRTGIPNIQVLLLEDNLRMVEMEEEIMFESELRGAMNTIELSVDKMYKDINYCAREMARQDIINIFLYCERLILITGCGR